MDWYKHHEELNTLKNYSDEKDLLCNEKKHVHEKNYSDQKDLCFSFLHILVFYLDF